MRGKRWQWFARRTERRWYSGSLLLVAGAIATVALALMPSTVLRAQVSDQSDPYLAALDVLGEVRYFEALRAYCASEDPASAASLAAAVETWMEAHSALYEKSLLILRSAYTTEELEKLEQGVRAQSGEQIAEIASVEPAKRVSRCRGLPAQISSSAMSPLTRPKLVAAIEGFGR
jgi:hypothetical protein